MTIENVVFLIVLLLILRQAMKINSNLEYLIDLFTDITPDEEPGNIEEIYPENNPKL